jgi:hypothetical protein
MCLVDAKTIFLDRFITRQCQNISLRELFLHRNQNKKSEALRLISRINSEKKIFLESRFLLFSMIELVILEPAEQVRLGLSS